MLNSPATQLAETLINDLNAGITQTNYLSLILMVNIADESNFHAAIFGINQRIGDIG